MLLQKQSDFRILREIFKKFWIIAKTVVKTLLGWNNFIE